MSARGRNYVASTLEKVRVNKTKLPRGMHPMQGHPNGSRLRIGVVLLLIAPFALFPVPVHAFVAAGDRVFPFPSAYFTDRYDNELRCPMVGKTGVDPSSEARRGAGNDLRRRHPIRRAGRWRRDSYRDRRRL